MRGGVAAIPGNISSQFVSALLIVGPLAEKGLTVGLTSPLESRPYVEMTIECLAEFGVEVVLYPALPVRRRPADIPSGTIPG